MAATSDIPLLAHDGTTTIVFTPSVAVANGSEYADTVSTAASPRRLVVKHVLSNVGNPSSSDVHSLSFSHHVADSVGVLRPASVTLTFRVPHAGPTADNRLDLVAFVKNFLTDANVTKLLIGGF